jgi:hypothetical protein
MMGIKDVTETKKEQPPALLFAVQGLGMGEKQKVGYQGDPCFYDA